MTHDHVYIYIIEASPLVLFWRIPILAGYTFFSGESVFGVDWKGNMRERIDQSGEVDNLNYYCL